MTLGGLLEATADRCGDRLLLLEDDVTREFDETPGEPAGPRGATYREFNRQVNGLALGLQAMGVSGGDRVGVVLPSGRDVLSIWFAVARLGAVMVPINPALTNDEIGRLLGHAGPVVLVARASVVAEQRRVGWRAAILVGAQTQEPGTVPFDSLLEPTDDCPRSKVSVDEALCILYTSGTTGQPKGCVLSHETFVRPAKEFCQSLELTVDDRLLGCLPLFHIAGLSFGATAVAAGASLALVDRFRGTQFWDQVSGSGATVFRHLGEMLAILCQRPPHPKERAHSLRAVYGGGASAEIAETFERRFGPRVVEGFGLTETNTVLCNTLRSRRRGSIGRRLPYSNLRVADATSKPLSYREVGELQVQRNPVMMTEYFKAPALTAEAFVGDWYRTGDLGWEDEDGYFYFVSRQKDIIRRRGENITAAEIEEVLNRNPGVALSAVVPVPDEVGGEEAKAFVVAAADTLLTAEALHDWCRRFLADFKVPRYLEICADLPRTSTNKTNKAVLRSMGTLGGDTFELHRARSGTT